MRRPSVHRAHPEIDAGLAKIHRLELRMGIGDVAGMVRIAEAFDVVDTSRVGAARQPRQTRPR